MSSACRRVGRRLPASDGEGALGSRDQAHVAECLRCQAEAVRYRRQHRLLTGLRTEVVPAPAGLVEDVMAEITGEEQPTRRIAVLGGAAAGAVVVAGAVAFVGLRKVTAA